MATEHWVQVTLDTVVVSKKGKKPKILKPAEFQNSLPYIDIKAFETGVIKQFADADSSNHCDIKDVLVVWDGARFGLTGTNQKGAIGSTLACLKPIVIVSSFLHKFIQSHYSTIQQKPKGMATPHVDPEVFWNLEFPLPPLGEQKRIVSKLDAILPKVKSAKQRLEKIPFILKRFRQSVLAAACSGKLTENWREENPDYKEWKTVKISDVATSRLGKMLDKSKNKGKPAHYLRNTNVRWFGFDLENVYKMKASQDELSQLWVKKGDIFICEGGEPGRCAIWDGENDIYIFQKALHRVRVSDSLLAKYLCFNIKHAADFGILEDYFTGTTIKHFTGVMLKKFQFPLPPLKEQQEIVNRVEKLFKLADSLEAKYQKAMARIEKLQQSVLAKAFRGELAEPDPDDEPADELLKRIMAEKEKLPKPKRKAGNKAKKPKRAIKK